MLFLLNPGGKKRRKYRKSTKAARRARSYRKGARTRRRRKTAGFLKTMIQRFTCGKGAVKRWKSMRRRCPVKARSTGAPAHGGIAGMIAAGHGPAVFARNGRRRRHKFSYRPKSRNYSSWIPDFIAPNPYWIPQYAYNPGGTLTSKLTEGYKPKTLINALPFAGGYIGNIALSRFVSGWLPGMFQSGLPKVAVNVATAGLLGAGVRTIAPQYAGAVFWGGVTQALVGVLSGLSGRLFGLGDFATVADAANARSLGGLGQMYDLGSNIISSELTESDPLEDLRGASGVTPEDYNSRRVGYSVNELSTSYPSTPERLQAANNAAVEGTAMEELMVEV